MMACLAIAALAGAVSCTDAPTAALDTVALTVVPGTDSVTLTYICGNMFRVRNASFEPRSVRWDIYGATPADTGSLRVRGRDVGAAYVDYFVTSRTKGTMRLFVGATLVNTKPNGNKAACAAPVDSAPLPTAPTAGEFSSKIAVESPSTSSPEGVEFRRTIVNVRFLATATAAQRRAFQAQFGAQLIAVYPTFFRFRVPDPGPIYSAFATALVAMAGHSAVQSATPLRSFERDYSNGARFLNDGNGHRRQDYLAGSVSVWPATALRLPQARGCETGLYGGVVPRIAIYEQNFPLVIAPDVARSFLSPVVRITKWRDTMTTPPSDSNRVEFQNHGRIVAGMISASGDDSVGVAGPLWRSDLRVFTFGNTDRKRGTGRCSSAPTCCEKF